MIQWTIILLINERWMNETMKVKWKVIEIKRNSWKVGSKENYFFYRRKNLLDELIEWKLIAKVCQNNMTFNEKHLFGTLYWKLCLILNKQLGCHITSRLRPDSRPSIDYNVWLYHDNLTNPSRKSFQRTKQKLPLRNIFLFYLRPKL